MNLSLKLDLYVKKCVLGVLKTTDLLCNINPCENGTFLKFLKTCIHAVRIGVFHFQYSDETILNLHLHYERYNLQHVN
jgi:hypothetical protein